MLVGLRPTRPGITLLVHSPDARAAVTAWVKLVLHAASHHGWRASVHVFGEQAPGWNHAWGPPHDRAWADDKLGSVGPTAALVRIGGTGSDLLFGLEGGLQRFIGLAGEPCHVWVELLEPKTEFTDLEWSVLPTPPSARAARGHVFREISVPADRVVVDRDEIEPPWSALPQRLAEAACARLLTALAHAGHKCVYDLDTLWRYSNPLASLTSLASLATGQGEAPR